MVVSVRRYFQGLLGGANALAISVLAAAAPPCDDLVSKEGDHGYRARGAYCEGLFVEDTRSSVRLRAVLAAVDAATISGAAVLQAAVPSRVPAVEYHLRVQSLDPRVHYQLDASVPDSGVFSWPVAEVIGSVPIDPTRLAPLSWTTTEPFYYVPVSLSGTAVQSPAAGAEVRIIIESTVPIQQYVARLSPREGGERTEIANSSSTSTTQLELTLPPRESPGYYKLWLRVLLYGESDPEGQSWLLWLP